MPVIALIIAVRLLFYALNRKRGGSEPSPVPPAMVVFGARLLVFVFALVVVGPSFGHWVGAALAGFVLLPSALLAALLIPAGVPYLSYYFTRLSFPLGLEREVQGGAVFNELRARLRWGFKLGPTDCDSLAGGLFQGFTDKRVRGANVAARAILDALSGDRDSARALFFAAQGLSAHNASRAVRTYAQSWLLADAAERGAWHEVATLSGYAPRSRRRWFLRAASFRLLGVTFAPKNFVLTCLWLLAPGRRSGASLLRAAKEALPRPRLPDGEIDDFLGARRALLTLGSWPEGTVSRRDLRRVAFAWQRVLGSAELGEHLEARRDALQASFAVDATTAHIEQEVIDSLAKLWRTAEPDLQSAASESTLLTLAKDQLQESLLSEIDALARALPHDKARKYDGIEQYWRNWARIRWLSHEFFVLLPERSYLLFDTVGLRGLNHAAWLYNHVHARVLAHEVFRWLHGIAPEQSENKQILAGNARLSRSA